MKDLVEWKDKPVKFLRDQVIEQLKFNLTKGHLEIDEFEQMVRFSLTTQSKKELLSLAEDLPEKELVPASSVDFDAYEAKESVISILSNQKKGGRWAPSKLLRVLTVLGSAEINFCEAPVKEQVTYIALDCWLGEVKIVIPEGVNIISNVKTILANCNHRGESQITVNAPTIVIEGKVVLGEVSIEEKSCSPAQLSNN